MATTIDGSIHVGAGAPPEFVRYSPDVDSLSPDFGENLDRVQDLTVEWPEQLSSPLTVAKLRIPRQDISGDDNLQKMDALSFSPWRVTAEHAPLGETMRLRKEVYRRASIFRHQLNGQARREPRSLAEAMA